MRETNEFRKSIPSRTSFMRSTHENCVVFIEGSTASSHRKVPG